MGTFETLLVLSFIAISAFLSSAEIALFSLSKFQLKMIRDRFKNAHKIIKKLLIDPSGILITVLILNELMNISLSTMIVDAVAKHDIKNFFESVLFFKKMNIPEWLYEMIIGTLITTPLVLLFCEITPKVVAARANTIVAPITAPVLLFFYKFTMPLRVIIKALLKILSLLIPGRKKPLELSHSETKKINEEDFLVIAEEAHKEGNIQSSELGMIKNIFDLDDTPILEITTPLSLTFTLPSKTTIADAITSVRTQSKGKSYSRVPVYSQNKNDIIGILYSKDLLISKLSHSELKKPISTLMWKPFNVSQNTLISTVFRRMKKQRIHMAIVTNERAEAIGVVTMNDVLEAMLDELLGSEEGEA